MKEQKIKPIYLRNPFFRVFFQWAGSLRWTFLTYLANFSFCLVMFMIMEKISFLDSLWFCTVSWFTVGYGDMVPQTTDGKIFAIYAIISAHILVILVTANFVTKLAKARDYNSEQDRDHALENQEEVNVAAIMS